MPEDPPGIFGIDALTRKVDALAKDVKDVAQDNGAILRHLSQLRQQLTRREKKLMAQLDEMNEKLANIAASETALGISIQTVVDYLKSNPNPTDLTQQLAELDRIGQALIDRNAQVLSNLPPTPEPPVPTRRK